MGFKEINNYNVGNESIIEHEHDSGATFIRYKTDDNNASFGVGFRTAPQTNCGTPHILEHSVLSGSKNYPVNELFATVKKSSICHFLNAMTYGDRTLYPAASHNDQELYKLADIYLDSVFNPLILDDPSIFKQEGWRIEEAESGPEYQGVVLNEMKNSAYNPKQLLDREAFQALLPDTTYAYEAGGLPTSIVDLTYDDLIDFYHRHYGAKNSVIYLYGSLSNEEKIIRLIDNKLSMANPGEKITIQSQTNGITPSNKMAQYAATSNQEQEEEIYFRLSGRNNAKNVGAIKRGAGIILSSLLSKKDGPFEEALRKQGFGRRVDVRYTTHIKQPVLSFDAKEITNNQIDDLQNAIQDGISATLDKGWSDEVIDAYIQDFKRKQNLQIASVNRGTLLMKQAGRSFAFNQDIAKSLDYKKGFAKIEERYGDKKFREMLSTYTREGRTVKVTLKPDANRVSNINQQLQEKLSKEQLASPKAESTVERNGSVPPPKNKALKQNRTLSKIEPISNNPAIYYKNDPNLTTVNLYYDITDHSSDSLQKLLTLVSNYTIADDKQYSYHEREQALKAAGGEIIFGIKQHYQPKTNQQKLYLKATIQATPGHEKRVMDIYKNIENKLVFNDYSAFNSQLEKQYRNLKSQLLIKDQIHPEMRKRVYRSYAPHSTVINRIKNIITTLSGFKNNRDDTITAIEQKNEMVDAGRIQYALVTTPDKHKESVLSYIQNHVRTENTIKPDPQPAKKGIGKEQTIYNKQSVAHVGIGTRFEHTPIKCTGAAIIVKAALDDYLWNEIRVKQGNYGVRSMVTRNGGFYISARHGTSPKENLEAIKRAGSWLSALDPTEKELRRYKASALSVFEPPRTPIQELEEALNHNLTNQTVQDLKNERNELIHADTSYLNRASALIDSLFEDGVIIKQGNPDCIDQPVGNVKKAKDLATQ